MTRFREEQPDELDVHYHRAEHPGHGGLQSYVPQERIEADHVDPLQIALLVTLMTTAVAFEVGIVLVLMIPALSAHAFGTIPAVVATSLVVSAPMAWFIDPTLRARYQKSHAR